MYLSTLMQGLNDKQRLALYSGITRAIRKEVLTGLPLVEQISIVTPKGVRNVRDYMIMTKLDAEQVVQLYVAAPVHGTYTRAQAEALSPEQLLADIMQQGKRRRRGKNAPPVDDALTGLAD